MNSRENNRPAEHEQSEQRDGVVVQAVGLRKSFGLGDDLLDVLNGIDMSIRSGEIVSVVGESGAGKSTLLHILGGLDRLTGGGLTVCGKDYSGMNENELADFRNRKIGFVFQFHHLMSDFDALENVMMPLLIRGDSAAQSRSKASSLLDMVGLAEREKHRPGKLSGGEQQRVAVARALATDPRVVLADEPTGNLDEKTAVSLHETLLEMNKNTGITFVIATHNREFAASADTMYELSGGRVNPVTGGER